jgi:two-component sensor histidine kinase
MQHRSSPTVLTIMFPTLVGLLFLLVAPLLADLQVETWHIRLENRLEPSRQRILSALALANAMRATAYRYLLDLDPDVARRFERDRKEWEGTARAGAELPGMGANVNVGWSGGRGKIDLWVRRFGGPMIATANFGREDVAPEERLFNAGIEMLQRSYDLTSAQALHQRYEIGIVRTLEYGSASVLGVVCLLLALLTWRNALTLRQALTSASQSAERLAVTVKETNHRVKNNLQTIGALIDMTRQESGETVPRQALDDIYQQIRTVAAVHDFLSHEHREDRVAVGGMLRKLVHLAAEPAGLTAQVESLDGELPVKEATSLALLVNELVLNAGKHGAKRIDVRLQCDGGNYELSVSDDGPGFPPDFSVGTHANLGLTLVETLTRHDLRGELEWTRCPVLHGARVEVRFPGVAYD